MPEAKMAAVAANAGKNKGGAYQDRDKPAQIRFSNISAAKGRHLKATVEQKVFVCLFPHSFGPPARRWLRDRYFYSFDSNVFQMI